MPWVTARCSDAPASNLNLLPHPQPYGGDRRSHIGGEQVANSATKWRDPGIAEAQRSMRKLARRPFGRNAIRLRPSLRSTLPSFATQMIADHKKAAEEFKAALGKANIAPPRRYVGCCAYGKTEPLKEFASKTLSTLEHHLEMVKELSSKMTRT